MANAWDQQGASYASDLSTLLGGAAGGVSAGLSLFGDPNDKHTQRSISAMDIISGAGYTSAGISDAVGGFSGGSNIGQGIGGVFGAISGLAGMGSGIAGLFDDGNNTSAKKASGLLQGISGAAGVLGGISSGIGTFLNRDKMNTHEKNMAYAKAAGSIVSGLGAGLSGFSKFGGKEDSAANKAGGFLSLLGGGAMTLLGGLSTKGRSAKWGE